QGRPVSLHFARLSGTGDQLTQPDSTAGSCVLYVSFLRCTEPPRRARGAARVLVDAGSCTASKIHKAVPRPDLKKEHSARLVAKSPVRTPLRRANSVYRVEMCIKKFFQTNEEPAEAGRARTACSASLTEPGPER